MSATKRFFYRYNNKADSDTNLLSNTENDRYLFCHFHFLQISRELPSRHHDVRRSLSMHVPSTSHHPEEVTAVSNSIQMEKPQPNEISKEIPQNIQDISSSGNSAELNCSRNSKGSKASLSGDNNEFQKNSPMENMISPSPIKEIPDLDCIMQDIQLPPPQEITISIEEKLDDLDFSSPSPSLFLNDQEQPVVHENQLNNECKLDGENQLNNECKLDSENQLNNECKLDNENQLNNEPTLDKELDTTSSLLDEIHPISHFHHYIHTHTNFLYPSLLFPYS